MNVARIAILALALTAAGLAAFLARNLVSDPGEQAAPQIIAAPTTEVLVAASNISLGRRVSEGDLSWQSWPEDAVNSAYITRRSRPNAMEQFAGSIARSPLLEGEPVTNGKLVGAEDAGFMAALLSPGMRAVSIKISPETGAGGFILPNDRVDVMLTERWREDDSGAQGDFRTTTILNNVRVLAVDQSFKEEEGEQVIVGKTATLELSPAQAEDIAHGMARGEITLSLRSLADSDPNATIVGDKKRTSGGTLRVVRYGVVRIETAKAGEQ